MRKIYALILILLSSVMCFAQTPALLRDINTGTADGITTFQRIVYGNLLLFVATNGQGAELWKTDGTTGNTVLLKDIYGGSTGSQIYGFYAFNGMVYFEATNATNGSELWKTDGTTGGTVMVKDILPGSAGAFDNIYFQPVWTHTGSFYFLAATSGTGDNELWKSDGTTAGTVLVKDIRPGATSSYPSGFYEFGNQLFFKANNGTSGAELWKTDGTTAGTVLVKDIRSGSNGGFEDIGFQVIWNHGGSFFFLAETNAYYDQEIWKSDGTTGGTVLVKDIQPGILSSYPSGFTEFNNQLFFEADDGTNGSELWRTDGTTAGTVLLKDIRPGSPGGFDNGGFQTIWVHGNNMFFLAETYAVYDREIWMSDGTTGGTSLLKDICSGVNSSYPYGFFEFNNELYFEADNCSYGAELWKTNGTNAGTVLVKDIRPGSAGAFDNCTFNVVWVHGGSFFFTAETYGLYDQELWKSDGTAGGTVLVKDIMAGPTTSYPGGFYPFGNQLFFEANNGSYGSELWKTDGSNAGTILVKDIRPGAPGAFDSGNFSPFIEWNGNFYFVAETYAVYDDEIWKSNGTDAGTALVLDIYSGPTGSNPWGWTILNNDYLLFVATNASYGDELWVFNMPGVATGIRENIPLPQVSIRPNPSNGIFHYDIRIEEQDRCAIEVFDMPGNLILKSELEPGNGIQGELDLSHSAKGIYLVRFSARAGAVNRKIIVN